MSIGAKGYHFSTHKQSILNIGKKIKEKIVEEIKEVAEVIKEAEAERLVKNLLKSEDIFNGYKDVNEDGYYHMFYDLSNAAYYTDETKYNDLKYQSHDKIKYLHSFKLLSYDDIKLNNFQDGYYNNEYGIRSSVAMVGVSKDALFLTFRGTATLGDMIDDGFNMGGHYEGYQELFNSIESYVTDNHNIETIYISGHSLGGQMAMQYMKDHPEGHTIGGRIIKFEAVTFEAANKFNIITEDTRFTNFEMRADIVPDFSPYNYGNTIFLEYEHSETLVSHFMKNINNYDPNSSISKAFDKAISTIDRNNIELNTRIYVDNNENGVVKTHTSVPTTNVILDIFAENITLHSLAKLGMDVVGNDLLEYLHDTYKFHTAFSEEEGILVLKTFNFVDGGTYNITDNYLSTVLLSSDFWTSSENFIINGKDMKHNLNIIGNSGINKIIGGKGDDILIGGDDKDTIIGNAGDDYLIGNDNYSYLSKNNSLEKEKDIKKLLHKYTDTFFSDEDVSYLYGGTGNDTMVGGDDHDYFFIDVDKYKKFELGDLKKPGSSFHDIIDYNQGNVDNIKKFGIHEDNWFSSDIINDHLIFSQEQLGIQDYCLNNDTSYTIKKSTYLPKKQGFTISKDQLLKVDNIDNYESSNIFYSFILEKSTGDLYFDLDGHGNNEEKYLVANIDKTGSSLKHLSHTQIHIVDNFEFIA